MGKHSKHFYKFKKIWRQLILNKYFSVIKRFVKQLKEAANLLIKGGLIIYPTDTVYALGCLINQPKTLEKLAKLMKTSYWQ